MVAPPKHLLRIPVRNLTGRPWSLTRVMGRTSGDLLSPSARPAAAGTGAAPAPAAAGRSRRTAAGPGSEGAGPSRCPGEAAVADGLPGAHGFGSHPPLHRRRYRRGPAGRTVQEYLNQRIVQDPEA